MWRAAHLSVEGGLRELRCVADAWKRIGLREQLAVVRLQVVVGCRLLNAARAGFTLHFRGECIGRGCGLVLRELLRDLVLHFVERLNVRFLLFFYLDDMKAVAALDQIARLSGRQRERDLLELRDGAAALDPTQFAAFLRAAGVVRILFGNLGKVPA